MQSKPSDFKPGDLVVIQPKGRFLREYRYQGGTAEAVPTLHTLPAFQAKVLVVTEQALICEGLTMQSGMAQWVQDACKASGIPEDVRVDLGYYSQVEKPLPADLLKGLEINHPL